MALNSVLGSREFTLSPGLLPMNEPRIYLLTISGLSFKVASILCVSDCTLSRDVSRQGLKKDGELNDSDFYDFYQEMTNCCFGFTKRFLGNNYRNLGMSTPYRMSKAVSVDSVSMLESDFDCHCSASLEGNSVYSASFFITAQSEFTLSYSSIKNKEKNEVDSGELQFF